MQNRLSDFIVIDKRTASSLFSPFDKSISVQDCSLIGNSMSNTGYLVVTDSGRFFLKLYSNTTDKIETAVYAFLQGQLPVPKLYYYDGSKERFPAPYAILQYLEGTSLKNYIHTQKAYPYSIVYEIGRMCGMLHRRKYGRDAWLDQDLNGAAPIPKTDEHILALLNGKAGGYLQREIRTRLSHFVRTNAMLFERLHAESVLCHGDINYMNILISEGSVWFIDFEFAHAGSIYHDIGKFFRTKGPVIQSRIDAGTCEAFAAGYESSASSKLPANWLTLAHLFDIASMLTLIDRDNTPVEWIADVEQDIDAAIRLADFHS